LFGRVFLLCLEEFFFFVWKSFSSLFGRFFVEEINLAG